MKIAIIASHSSLNAIVAKSLIADGHDVYYYEEQESIRAQLKKVFKKKISLLQKIDQLCFLVLVVVLSQLSLLFNLGYFIKLFRDSNKHPILHYFKIQSTTLNTKNFIHRIADEKFDTVILLGCSILKKGWFSHDIPLINVHPGYLPYYRGRFCWLWPFLNFDYDKVGFTIHKVSKDVDVGEVYFQKKIKRETAAKILNPAGLYRFYFLCTIYGIRKVLTKKEVKSIDSVQTKLPIYSEGSSLSILRFIFAR